MIFQSLFVLQAEILRQPAPGLLSSITGFYLGSSWAALPFLAKKAAVVWAVI